MKKLTGDEPLSNQSGFALVIVLGLLLLMSMLIGIAYRHLHHESLITSQLISRDGVFQDAEKRLHECTTLVDALLPPISSNGCCLIEKSSPASTLSYFRVSVHVVDNNPLTASQSRQQQLIRVRINPSAHQIKQTDVLSWREILDPKWDKELDQSDNNPWEAITPCLWTRENIL